MFNPEGDRISSWRLHVPIGAWNKLDCVHRPFRRNYGFLLPSWATGSDLDLSPHWRLSVELGAFCRIGGFL